jgi:hypothetical protein
MHVNTMAPTPFPRSTGPRLPKKSAKLTSAPHIIPSGMRNMLATACSSPRVTKVVMGSQMAKILPPTVRADVTVLIATFTSQFAPTAWAAKTRQVECGVAPGS